jgi:hypothetical protein
MLVDSTDRYPNGYPTNQVNASGNLVPGVTSSSNWKLNNPNAALYGYFTRLAVTQVQLQYNLPTIVSTDNQTSGKGNSVFYVSQNAKDPSGVPSATSSIVDISTISGGWYDYNTLATAIASALNNATPALTGTFTCEYLPQTGGFLIGNVTNDFYILSPDDCANIPGGAATAAEVISIARCLNTLGLTSSSGFPLAAEVSGTAPSMLYTEYIDIVSRYLTKYQRAKDFTTLKNPTKTSILIRVFMTPPNTTSRPVQTLTTDGSGVITVTTQSPFAQPFTICVDPNQPKFMSWSPDEAIANFDLQLLDSLGIELPFSETVAGYGSQCEYQLTLLASES